MPAKSHIVIAGVGLISPLEAGAWPTFRRLLAGDTIADRCERLPDDTAPVDLVRAVGSVRCAQHVADDPTIEIAERAAREAVTEAGLTTAGLSCEIGTSKGAVRRLTDAAINPTSALNAEVVALGPCGYVSNGLAQRLNLAGCRHHIAACASGLYALHQARFDLLRPDDEDVEVNNVMRDFRLVVTAESAMLPMFIHSYRKLGVLAPAAADTYRGLPLDRRRNGFMLGEMAAAVLLRRARAPKPGDIELIDTLTATDPHDMLKPAPRMGVLQELAARLLRGRSIEVIHPHAPGTRDHDAAELAALESALEDARSRKDQKPVALYASKGAIGHGLGASGLASLVIAVLAARCRKLPPMPWLADEIASGRFVTHERTLERSSTHAIFAAGFGGHLAGAVIRAH